MSKAIIVFSFDESEDKRTDLQFAFIVQKAQSLFSELDNVKVHAAINEPAEKIMSILNKDV